MTLLEVITKASANPEVDASQSSYPFNLNPNDIFFTLKPTSDNPNPAALVHLVTGFRITKRESAVIELVDEFFKMLKQKIENPNELRKSMFIEMLNQFLDKIRKTMKLKLHNVLAEKRCISLIEKVGFMMGEDVAGLVLEACIFLEIWDVAKSLIVNKLVRNCCHLKYVDCLVEKKRADLLCLCIKNSPDLGPPELLCIMKFFLCPPVDAYNSMLSVKKEWESQGIQAIEMAMDENTDKKESVEARRASIVLMAAHDGFTPSELCMHYLVVGRNVDESVLSSIFGQLNGKEMKRLLQYVSKWLNKYEKFPEASIYPKMTLLSGLEECFWVPRLPKVVTFLRLLLDENYSWLVLHPEFHEELGLVAASVRSLATESKLCSFVANVADKLRVEVKDSIK